MKKPKYRGYSHLIAAFISIFVLLLLVLYVHEEHEFGAWVYGLGVTLLLTGSAIYHVPNWSAETKPRVRRLDRCMIYLSAATTYTPFCLYIGGPAESTMLPAVWAAVIIGMLTAIFMKKSRRWISAAPYVLLGYCLVPYLPDLWELVPHVTFIMIMVGGAFYTLGAIIYVRQWPDPAPETFGFHEVFHLMIIGACTSHYVAVWTILVGG